MFLRHPRLRALWQQIKESFSVVFDNPKLRPAKKAVITVVGVIVTLLGVVLIILPGPAFILIPIGLAILAKEYEFARIWLRKCQRWMTICASKDDDFFAKRRAKH